AEYREFAARVQLSDITPIPLSAVHGDNIIEPGANMPWYSGPTLMSHLENMPLDVGAGDVPLRMAVQWVNRPNADFRGFAGRIASGSVSKGEKICVLPSGRESSVSRIVTSDGDITKAVAGQSVTLTLADEIDISRGDLLAAPALRPA